MSLWSRIVNAFRGDQLDRSLEQELRVHIEEALGDGRSEEEARRQVGNLLRVRERSHDIKVLGWLEALVADARFGVRQLRKNWAASSAAIPSLALSIGACTGEFRLLDAVLLRPLPVSEPERLFYLTRTVINGSEKVHEGTSFAYPLYRKLRDAVGGDADLIGVSWSGRSDITYGGDSDIEKVYQQYVSGNMFPVFGLRPALGRLFTPADDDKPGAHSLAVLSYEYWSSRFGRDPKVVGRTFRAAQRIYQIIGVAPNGFTGTQTGTFTDIFVPCTMNTGILNEADGNWLRVFVRPKPGRNIERLRERFQAVYTADHRDRLKEIFRSDARPQRVEAYLHSKISLHSAATGASQTQEDYRRALVALGVLVMLVLLIAAANVANLLTAQAAARAREMALRVSIGAGRGRLLQLVLVESTILALAATLLGSLFAWWSAPWVVSKVNPPDNPLQLALPADWRVLGFTAALAIAVALLFGLAPALRASGVRPASALKGSENPRSQQRLTHGLIVAQVAFCFGVNFAAGLFSATFHRLTQQPTGFEADNVLLLSTVVKRDVKQSPSVWAQVGDRLRSVQGVESAAWSGWALLTGGGWDASVRLPGLPIDSIQPYFLRVSPGFLATMRIHLMAGRDFTPTDSSGAAIVTEAFARRYFAGRNPVGGIFERGSFRQHIVGLVNDVRYEQLREDLHPVVFVPMEGESWGTFEVRVSGNHPGSLTSLLRTEVSRARPDFRVASINTQSALVDQWSIRERLLSTISSFFATIALLLAGIGLYGVLNYSVLRRTREIGIRMALGARPGQLALNVSLQVAGLVFLGVAAGMAAGISSQVWLQKLLFSVKTTDPIIVTFPLIYIVAAAFLAALAPIVRALRIDPAQILRSE